jgi:uncharacterized SAM-binding protein YcdF (DUF218 family)
MWVSARWGRLLGALAAVLFVALAFTPVPNALYARWAPPLSAPTAADQAQAIVVLGAGSGADGFLTDDSLRRAVHGIRLWRRGLAPRLLLLGPPNWNGPAESAVRAELARDLGVPAEAILVGDQAQTTRQEARESASLLQPRGVRRILLVTGTQHMPRARPLFEREGFEVLPAAVDEMPRQTIKPEMRLDIARRLIQEALARTLYRATGAL